MAAKARLAELVAANAPVFHLHPDDHFMPCSVEWFLHHSELQQEVQPGGGNDSAGGGGCGGSSNGYKSGPPRRKVLERGQVNAAALAAAAALHANLALSLDDEGRWGYPKDLLDDVPLYVHAKEVVDAAGRPEALELNYLTFYAHNGPYSVAGVKVGAHDGDWEHITLRLDAETGSSIGAYFHAHRNHDGIWVAAEQLPRDVASGRPAAFVALHGHGTYPAAGRQLRAMLFANDHCSGAGPVWRPRRCFLLPFLPEAVAAAGGPPQQPQAPGEARRIMRVPSRGSCLPSAALDRPPRGRPPANASRKRAAGWDGSHTGGSGFKGGSPAGADTGQGVHGSCCNSHAVGVGSEGADAVGPANNSGPDAPGTGAAEATAALTAPNPAPGAVEVVEGPAEWLRFTGRWGTLGGGTPSPITQRWFLAAEPPVSRTLLRRVLHFMPEARVK